MVVTEEIAKMAELAAEDLEGRRLIVKLAWPTMYFGYRGIRVVDERNPAWYRKFCADHLSPRHHRRAVNQ